MQSCWEAVFESRPYKLLATVKDTAARIYVLATVKHILEALIEAKAGLETVTKDEDVSLKTVTAIVSKNLKSLTAFTNPCRPGERERRSTDRGFLKGIPVPSNVSRYFREIPYLSHCFLALVRSSLKLLGTLATLTSPLGQTPNLKPSP